MSDRIKIPLSLKSRNEIDKLHWTDKMQLRSLYQLYIRQQISHYRIEKATPGSKYSLKITACRRRRIRDYDNLVGGCKQLLDALARELYIWDDDTKYIGNPEIEQALGEPEIVIERRKI